MPGKGTSTNLLPSTSFAVVNSGVDNEVFYFSGKSPAGILLCVSDLIPHLDAHVKDIGS